MSRIDQLAERRRRLWAQGWERWERDFEARINFLSKLLGEEYETKRKQALANKNVPRRDRRPRVHGVSIRGLGRSSNRPSEEAEKTGGSTLGCGGMRGLPASGGTIPANDDTLPQDNQGDDSSQREKDEPKL